MRLCSSLTARSSYSTDLSGWLGWTSNRKGISKRPVFS